MELMQSIGEKLQWRLDKCFGSKASSHFLAKARKWQTLKKKLQSLELD